jgi:signal transduction histidine kinase
MGVTLQSLDLLRYYERNRPDEPVEERLDGAINSLTEAMQILQEISAELRRSIGTEGLEGALRKYLASMVSPSIEVRLTAVGELKQLPSNVGEELFLVMREAVHNAVRHGNPTGLWLDIDASGNAFRGSVRDDGNGFDINGVFAQRNGLASMAERAELLHGKLEIVSTCGQGTTVTVWIPAEPGL